LILAEEKGPAVGQIVSKDAVLFTGDQWFESVFLQCRVSSELVRNPRAEPAGIASFRSTPEPPTPPASS
jgi:hypothetical protein